MTKTTPMSPKGLFFWNVPNEMGIVADKKWSSTFGCLIFKSKLHSGNPAILAGKSSFSNRTYSLNTNLQMMDGIQLCSISKEDSQSYLQLGDSHHHLSNGRAFHPAAFPPGHRLCLDWCLVQRRRGSFYKRNW